MTWSDPSHREFEILPCWRACTRRQRRAERQSKLLQRILPSRSPPMNAAVIASVETPVTRYETSPFLSMVLSKPSELISPSRPRMRRNEQPPRMPSHGLPLRYPSSRAGVRRFVGLLVYGCFARVLRGNNNRDAYSAHSNGDFRAYAFLRGSPVVVRAGKPLRRAAKTLASGSAPRNAYPHRRGGNTLDARGSPGSRSGAAHRRGSPGLRIAAWLRTDAMSFERSRFSAECRRWGWSR